MNSNQNKDSKLKNALVDYIHVLRSIENRNASKKSTMNESAYGSYVNSRLGQLGGLNPYTRSNTSTSNFSTSSTSKATRDLQFKMPPKLFTKRW